MTRWFGRATRDYIVSAPDEPQLGQARRTRSVWINDRWSQAISNQSAMSRETGIIGMWANAQGPRRQTLKASYEAGKASYPGKNAADPFEQETRPRQENFKLFQRQLERQRSWNQRRLVVWDDQSRCDP